LDAFRLIFGSLFLKPILYSHSHTLQSTTGILTIKLIYLTASNYIWNCIINIIIRTYGIVFCQKLVKSSVLLFQHKLPIASKLNRI